MVFGYQPFSDETLTEVIVSPKTLFGDKEKSPSFDIDNEKKKVQTQNLDIY